MFKIDYLSLQYTWHIPSLPIKGGQKDPDWFDSSWVLADGGQVESGGEVRNRSETNLKTLGSSLHESFLKSSVATIYTTVR